MFAHNVVQCPKQCPELVNSCSQLTYGFKGSVQEHRTWIQPMLSLISIIPAINVMEQNISSRNKRSMNSLDSEVLSVLKLIDDVDGNITVGDK